MVTIGTGVHLREGTRLMWWCYSQRDQTEMVGYVHWSGCHYASCSARWNLRTILWILLDDGFVERILKRMLKT